MPFTPVAPTLSQTNRQDINDFLAAILTAFMAAHPSVARKQWSEIPFSLTGEGPFVYLGDITEAIRHDSGVRVTEFSGVLGYIDHMADPQETNTRMNTFADFMRDWMTANARICPPGILEQTGTKEGAPPAQGNAQYLELDILWKWTVQEGRI